MINPFAIMSRGTAFLSSFRCCVFPTHVICWAFCERVAFFYSWYQTVETQRATLGPILIACNINATTRNNLFLRWYPLLYTRVCAWLSVFETITCTTLWAYSWDDNWWYISSQKIGFDVSCKLSLKDIICMKCQTCFFFVFLSSKKENIFQIAER